MTWNADTTERFGGVVRRPRIQPYIPARTEPMGSTSERLSGNDIGKAVKLHGNVCLLTAFGEPIYGFIESVQAGTDNGYSIGGVLADPGLEALATDELGNLAVGDLVVSGTPVARGTKLTVPANVVRAGSGQSTLLVSGTIGMKSAAKATVESGATLTAMVGGKIVSKAAGDLPALTGKDVAAGKHNVYAFFIDAAAALSVELGGAADTQAAVIVPQSTPAKTLVGLVYVTGPTGGFTGGTTLLDATGVNALYVNPVGFQAPANPHAWQVMAYYGTQGAGKQVMLRKI